jgi:PGF-pre-PGF domain-containing protein
MILFLLILLPSLASATVTVSITQSGADPSSVMAERTFTVTASGWSGDCNSAYLDLSQCGVCSISENQTKSISGSSVSWTTLTASRATSQTISVSITGTCTPDSGSVSFDIKTSPSLVATVSPTSASVEQGSTFTLSLNIQNNGETTARFGSITVSPSYFNISSGCSPSDISGGGSAGISCTISASDSATLGSNTLSILISPTNADSVTKTVSVTVSEQTTTTTPGGGNGGGDGGGGGGGNKTEKKKSQTWSKITPGKAEIMHVDDPDIGLKMINITVKNPAQTVTITVTKLAGKPASVVHEISGKVYKYIEINASNLVEENISNIKIQFQVNKSWISSNNINRATIALNRYKDNIWQELTTKELSEDNDYLYYEAETPGFSTFAVTGEEAMATTVAATTVATTIATTVKTTIPYIPTEMGGIQSWVIILLILIVAVIIIFFLVYKKRPHTQQRKI